MRTMARVNTTNKTYPVNKVEILSEMRTSKSPLLKTKSSGSPPVKLRSYESPLVKTDSSLSCGSCAMLYTEYKHLLEHLYWRHGTESHWCSACGLKRWQYAPHVCHVLPINEAVIFEESESNSRHGERESIYCFCGKNEEESLMIGCDGPRCVLQWYHFKCVGVVSPPDGDWFCPECVKNKAIALDKVQDIGVKT